MSDIPIGDSGKPMEQPNNDLPEASHSSVATSKISMPPKNLSDMPIHVVGLIIERSEYKEQLKLRKVSKSLRAIVDNLKPACKSIHVAFKIPEVAITFDYLKVMYSGHFKKVAFDDLASTLKNPKLELEEFLISDYILENEENDKYCNELQCVLGSLNHQVSVKRFDIMLRSSSWLLSTLPHLKPGVLEKISLHTFRGYQWRAGMDKVALLEQWKQAEEIRTNFSFDIFPIEYATHFKRFQIYGGWIDNDNLNRIKDFFSETELCTLSWSDFYTNFFALYQLLGTPVSSNTREEVFHHPIPDSDCYFEIKKARRTLRLDIKKKKRENHR